MKNQIIHDVSFAPSKNGGPVRRKAPQKPSVSMRGVWEEGLGSLVVELGEENLGPTLHLTYDDSYFYEEDECLIPAISTDAENSEEQFKQVSWIDPLKPYFRVPKEDWDKFTLFKYAKHYGISTKSPRP